MIEYALRREKKFQDMVFSRVTEMLCRDGVVLRCIAMV